MKKTVLVALFLILAALLCACAPPAEDDNPGETIEPKNRMFYEYFDTVCVFYDYTGGTDTEFKRLYTMVENELSVCHELFDIYNTYDGVNNVKTVNDRAGGEPIPVDARFIELLEFSKEMYSKTDGHVNVMMGAVLSIWHEHRAEGVSIPNMDVLLSAAEHTDINSLEINKDACTVRITDPEASLDLGAVAKGFVAERIAKMLEAEGVHAYALDLGGNLRVGEKLSGDGWQSAIKNPDLYSEEPYIRTLEVKNASLVTSGSYERFYTVGGVRYHHIINKDTLMPENRYTSVSILTPSSAVADALSTALFNMTEDEARATLKSFPDTEATLVYPDGRVEIIPSDA